MTHVHHANDRTFDQEVLQSATPVLIDFYAPWCAPCRMLAPVLENLAADFAGRAKIVKVNVDESPVLARQFRIQGIPTLMVAVNGRIVGQTAGVLPAAALRKTLEQYVAAASGGVARAG